MNYQASSNIGQYLNERFLAGQGRITQTPGRAHPSVRKFYSHHKGYDLAVKPGTPLNTQGLQYKGSYMDRTGYGLRAMYYNPEADRSYVFSHLSRVDPQGRAYTGGIPGVHGKSTGPHVDIEIKPGLYNTQSQYIKQLQNIAGNIGSGVKRTSFNIPDLIGKVKNKFGQHIRVIAMGSPKKLAHYQKKLGGQIVRL